MFSRLFPRLLFSAAIVLLGLWVVAMLPASVEMASERVDEPDGDGPGEDAAPPAGAAPDSSKFVVQVAITAALLPAALYVILSRKFHKGSEKWAYGTIATLLGFWLV